SLVRPGQDWCTLCHADLRPQPRTPEPVPEPVQPLPDPEPLVLAESVAPAAAPVGKHARHAAPEPEAATAEPVPEAELAELMAVLAAESADPLGGMLSRLPESQGMRVLVALSVGGTVAVLLVVVFWLIGLVFG